eukprot:scaffold1123_cov168-Amphora_coffeaeformis.AAC.26
MTSSSHRDPYFLIGLLVSSCQQAPTIRRHHDGDVKTAIPTLLLCTSLHFFACIFIPVGHIGFIDGRWWRNPFTCLVIK